MPFVRNYSVSSSVAEVLSYYLYMKQNVFRNGEKLYFQYTLSQKPLVCYNVLKQTIINIFSTFCNKLLLNTNKLTVYKTALLYDEIEQANYVLWRSMTFFGTITLLLGWMVMNTNEKTSKLQNKIAVSFYCAGDIRRKRQHLFCRMLNDVIKL